MSLIAKMHVARKQLGLDEDTYRAALRRATGKDSAKDMSRAEQLTVIEAFRAAGFNDAPARRSGGRRLLTGKYAGKLQALWIAGWNLGLVKNRDDAALLAFVKRQTGIDHTRFLRDGEDAFKAIEALKGWLARAGVDWSDAGENEAHQRTNGFKIARAQWEMVPELRSLSFYQAVSSLTGIDAWECVTESNWHEVMNTFGARVRALKGD